jgi:hypothetical protein
MRRSCEEYGGLALSQTALAFAQRFRGGRRERTFWNARRERLTNRAPDAHV